MRRALHRSVLLGRAAIFRQEEDDNIQDSPRVGCPCGEEGDGRKGPTGQLHTRLDGEVKEEIRDILEWGGGSLGGVHQFRLCGFSSRGFHTRGCFLIFFPAAGLLAAVDFGLGFLGPSIFLMAVTLGCVCASVNLLRRGFSILWSGGCLDSSPLLGLSAPQRAWPAGLSEQRIGIWWHPFGHLLSLAEQGLPSLLST